MNKTRVINGRGIIGIAAIIGVAFLGSRLYWTLRYNLVTLQLTWAVVTSTVVDPQEILLAAEQRQTIEAGFQQLPAAMISSAPIRYHQGQLSFWVGDDTETIVRLTLHPGKTALPMSNLLLGFALSNMDRKDEALEVWRATPNVENYFLNKAAGFEYKHVYTLAESYYELARTIRPGQVAAESGYWFAHSMNLLQAITGTGGEVDQAIERAVRLNSASFSRQLELGEALVYAQKPKMAETILASAIQLDPSSHWPRYYLGLAYYQQKEYHLAEQSFIATLDISPDFARAHHWLARTLAKLGENDQALIQYYEAVRLSPEDQSLANELEAFEKRIKQP